MKRCSFVALMNDLKTCTLRKNLEWGKKLHEEAAEAQVESNRYIATALIRMYTKCGSMVDAHHIFDNIRIPDVMSWNVLLQGYAENGNELAALNIFRKMTVSNCAPNALTYITLLKACTSLSTKRDKIESLRYGREIHSHISLESNQYVQNTLLDMYAKCGSMVDARKVFESMEKPSLASWTALLFGYCQNGEGETALELFSRMKTSGFKPDARTYVAVLKVCTTLAVTGAGKENYLKYGRQIHSEIGIHLNDYVKNALIDMYSRFGSIVDARRVFDSILDPDIVCWTSMILGYAECGEGRTALEFFSKMKTRGFVLDCMTYVAALKACTSLGASGCRSDKEESLRSAREIHSEIGPNMNQYVRSALVDVYAKCGRMFEARRVFDSARKPNVVTWNALLSGYVDNDEGDVALDLFSNMKACGHVPDTITYVTMLKACASLALNRNDDTKRYVLEYGRGIHGKVADNPDVYLRNALVDMYAKCGSMLNARDVFDSIQEPNVVSWTTLLLGYADNEHGDAVLELFPKMKASGCVPSSITYIVVFKVCTSMGALPLGRKFHVEINQFPVRVVTCLVDFYAKCGSVAEAREVFDTHPTSRNIATWNALLAGYCSFDSDSVFTIFDAMQEQGFFPDGITMVAMLLCCSHAGLVDKAKEYFEAMAEQYGVTPDIIHCNCMMDVLGRANKLNEAMTLLRRSHCGPNAVTWRVLLGACRKWKNLEIGRLVFQSFMQMSGDSSTYVLMAQIYGNMDEARQFSIIEAE